jgi:trk system potassium uptake protein TrkA
MKVLILGGGKVGVEIANYLRNQEQVDVTIIEKSEEIAEKIRADYDINVLVGDAINVEILKEADAEMASHMIATMSSDEQNIIACKFAWSLFNIKTKIARIRSNSFLQGDIFELFLKENFNIDIVIHPEAAIAHEISKIACVKGTMDVIDLESVIVIELKCLDDTQAVNTPLAYLSGVTNLNIFVLTITRNNETFFPDRNDVLLPGDYIYIGITQTELSEVLDFFGYHKSDEQHILIVGGGNISTAVLQLISNDNPAIRITLLEESIRRAEYLAQHFPQITTVLGSGINSELLEITHNIDTAIVATNTEKNNVLSTIFLQRFGIPRILTLSESKNYAFLFPLNGNSVLIDPSTISIEIMLRQLRHGKIKSVTSLRNQQGDVVEAIVTESCLSVGNEVKSLRQHGKIMPFFVIRDHLPIPLHKNVKLQLGDVVIMLVARGFLKSVKKNFSNYFYTKNSETKKNQDDEDELERLINEDDD